MNRRSVNGQSVWAVEGIAEKPDQPGQAVGSVDWVTEAGAGGKVVAAIEEAQAHGGEMDSLLESFEDNDLRDYLETYRPEVLEGAAQPNMFGGDNRGGGNPPKEDKVDLTTEQLAEAFTSEQARESSPASLDERFASLQESMEETREEAVRDATAEYRRQIELRDFRDTAHRQIEEAKLPEKFAQRAKGEFELSGETPTDKLNVFPDVDYDGNVVKTAEENLTESVTEVIEEMRDLAGSVSPTMIRGQGGRSQVNRTAGAGDGDGDGDGEQKISRVDPATRQMLREAGIPDDQIEEAWTADNPLRAVIGS